MLDLQQLSCHLAVYDQNYRTLNPAIVMKRPNYLISTAQNAVQILVSGTKLDGYALSQLLRASSDMGCYSYGQQLHSYILRSGFTFNVYVAPALLRFYKRIGTLRDAHKVFVEIPHPSVFCWNSLISGYVQIGECSKALRLFLRLNNSGTRADAYSFTAALSACGLLSLSRIGQAIHSNIVKYNFQDDIVVGNCLIDMYGKCQCVKEAIKVFDEMTENDIISWNSVIAATARNGKLDVALGFLQQTPNPDTISYNEVINGIAQFGYIEDAIHILFNMPNPNSSSWNSILTGFVNRHCLREAIDFFVIMHRKNIEMDEYTFSTTLSCIAGLAALTWGKLIHCSTMKYGLNESVVVGSAMIDMYSKCGKVGNAETIFRSLPEKNLITWNTMISGYAQNGDSIKVIKLFEELKINLKPDWVTFLNVLASCSNSDMSWDKTMKYFDSMIEHYEIKPTVEHCCSMIRLMGQRGEVRRAWRMIYDMSFGSCGVVWKALLGACGTCSDLNIAKIAVAKVIELDGDSDYVYVIMSNILAHHGKWGDVHVMRKLMGTRGIRKEVGCSWIELYRN